MKYRGRMLFLYELAWCKACETDPRNVIDCRTIDDDEHCGFKVLAKSARPATNKQILQLYNYLRHNGNLPYMTETKAGDIRIHYFKRGV